MTNDGWPDSGFDSGGDPGDIHVVPYDHPAFRQSADDDESVGILGEPGVYVREIDEVGGAVIDFPIGRYDGFGNQGEREVGEPFGSDELRQGATDARLIESRLDASRRDVATRAIGQRNAIAHTRGSVEGERERTEDGERSLHDGLAASLEQAGVRFRDELGGDYSAVGVVEGYLNASDAVKANGGPVKPHGGTPLIRSRMITRAPNFQHCELRGQLAGLKSNTAGDWVVTLRIDADCFQEVAELGSAHGLALDVTIRRKSRD